MLIVHRKLVLKGMQVGYGGDFAHHVHILSTTRFLFSENFHLRFVLYFLFMGHRFP